MVISEAVTRIIIDLGCSRGESVLPNIFIINSMLCLMRHVTRLSRLRGIFISYWGYFLCVYGVSWEVGAARQVLIQICCHLWFCYCFVLFQCCFGNNLFLCGVVSKGEELRSKEYMSVYRSIDLILKRHIKVRIFDTSSASWCSHVCCCNRRQCCRAKLVTL